MEDVPESPTTARPLEMDDDDVQDTSIIANDATATPAKTPATTKPTDPEGQISATEVPAEARAEQEAPPTKPPRPMSEAQKNEHILKEAFPTVDQGVIKAVLRASSGRVEPAFNALLGE